MSWMYRGRRFWVAREAGPGGRTVYKLVAPDRKAPDAHDRLLHEQAILEQLTEVAGVAVARGLVTYRGQPALALDDAGEETLADRLSAPLGLDVFLDLSVSMATILDAVHERGVIHQDVRPDNVVIGSTSTLTLIDFERAVTSPYVASTRRAPFESALTYVAPERAGKLEQLVDTRSDLYSLGIVFYEMLTGSPPFRSKSPLELAHAHAARSPSPPAAVDPSIPSAISALVLKLLAKAPEERYQTAAALAVDLREAREQWSRTGAVSSLDLGHADFTLGPSAPDRLYGRDQERAFAREVLARVRGGEARTLLVGGEAGVGKSSLVRAALEEELGGYGGWVISGKVDQRNANIPYAPLREALSELVQLARGAGEERWDVWKRELSAQMGAAARLLVDVAPELSGLLGAPLSERPDTQPQQARTQIHFALKSLLKLFAGPERPVALFVDDLQWADAATLDALAALILDEDSRYLALVGAWRPGDDGATHPLCDAMDARERAEAAIAELHLGPLPPEAVADLLARALRQPRERLVSLAEIVGAKTGGNPFFILQLVRTLQHRGLLYFDARAGAWSWDSHEIEAVGLSENVVDFLVSVIDRLPERTRTRLSLLSCVGRSAEVGVLAGALGAECESEIRAALHPAVREGLLSVRHDHEAAGGMVYEFRHDRVQQAAYATLSAPSRASAHRQVGRRLVAMETERRSDDRRLFAAADQFASAKDALEDEAERLEIAALEGRAGSRALAASAFSSGLTYFRAGLALIGPEAWRDHRDLVWGLHLGAAECAYLCGEYELSDALVGEAFARAKTRLEKAEIYVLSAVSTTTRGDRSGALCKGLDALADLGYPLDRDVESTPEAAREALRQMAAHRADVMARSRRRASREDRAVLEVLVNLFHAAWFVDRKLCISLAWRSAAFVLERGDAPEASSAFAHCAISLSEEHIRDAEAYIEAAEAAAVAFDDRRQLAHARFLRVGLVDVWLEPLATVIARLNECFDAAVKAGELRTAGYALSLRELVAFDAGVPLDKLLSEIDADLRFLRGFRLEGNLLFQLASRQPVRCLRGMTRGRTNLEDEEFSEEDFLEAAREVPAARCVYHIRRLQISYVFREFDEAREQAEEAEKLSAFVGGYLPSFELKFYGALAKAAALDKVSGPERDRMLADISARRASLARWAKLCPSNFRHAVLLIDAEVARVRGDAAATDYYHHAVEAARAADAGLDWALACELTARHEFHQGRPRLGMIILREAWDGYAVWGASEKLRALEEEFTALAGSTLRPDEDAGRAVDLDISSLLQAAESITSEVSLDRLLARLIRVGIETAGAERVVVILEQDGEPVVRAVGTGEEAPRLARTPLADFDEVVAPVVWRVRTTRRALRIGEATRASLTRSDPRARARRVRSVLAVPVQRQSSLVGTIYFENNLTSHVFPPATIRVLELLSAQVAISLDNSVLFEDLRAEKEENARLLKEAEEALSLREDFLGVAAHELNTPLTSLLLSVQGVARGAFGESQDSVRVACDIAVRQARKLAGLVKELLEASRITRDYLVLEPERVDLGRLARDVVGRFEFDFNRAGSPVELDLEEGVEGYWDRSRLDQVATNLVSNAIKFGQGRRIRVGVGWRRHVAYLEVRDRGIGIREEHVPRIFERFSRGVSARDFGGMGLGLFIVRSVVEAHGGSVSVDTAPGEGTRMTVELPATPSAAPGAP